MNRAAGKRNLRSPARLAAAAASEPVAVKSGVGGRPRGSIPLTTSLSSSIAARHGILIKDRLALEASRTVDAVLFDKTGTLTKGSHVVVGVLAVAVYGMSFWQAVTGIVIIVAVTLDYVIKRR